MRILLGRTAGFCMGVKRALDLALEAGRSSPPPVVTHGPLIHNRQVVELLESRGVRSLDDASLVEGGTVVLRAHGVPEKEVEKFCAAGMEIVDATCTKVKLSLRQVKEAARSGRSVILAGDRGHAEIEALTSNAEGRARTVSNLEEARTLEDTGPATLVAQSTFNAAEYARMAETLKERFNDLVVVDSICRSTETRQAELRELASRADAVVVVGGRHSANTRRLAEIARGEGVKTFHVELASELDPRDFAGVATVAVTAGASTPGWETREVVDRLREMGSGPVPYVHRFLRVMVASGLYMSLVAAALARVVVFLDGRSSWVPASFIAFAYVFTTYALNRMRDARRIPVAVSWELSFVRSHRRGLLAASGVMIVASLAVCTELGWPAAVFLATAYVAGMVYGADLPKPLRVRSINSLRDVPASKDVFAAAAWTAVIVFLPWLAGLVPDAAGAAVAGVYVFLVVFSCTVMLDLRDVESDRLTGAPTIALKIGEKETQVLVGVVALAALLFMLWAGTAGIVSSVSLPLAIGPGILLIGLRMLAAMNDETLSEVAVWGALLAAVLGAELWQLFGVSG